nr:MAG TPA: hypothetical protein [Caudoviricetes sp.]
MAAICRSGLPCGHTVRSGQSSAAVWQCERQISFSFARRNQNGRTEKH